MHAYVHAYVHTCMHAYMTIDKVHTTEEMIEAALQNVGQSACPGSASASASGDALTGGESLVPYDVILTDENFAPTPAQKGSEAIGALLAACTSHACLDAYIHACMHACMHAYAHTYMHACMPGGPYAHLPRCNTPTPACVVGRLTNSSFDLTLSSSCTCIHPY